MLFSWRCVWIIHASDVALCNQILYQSLHIYRMNFNCNLTGTKRILGTQHCVPKKIKRFKYLGLFGHLTPWHLKSNEMKFREMAQSHNPYHFAVLCVLVPVQINPSVAVSSLCSSTAHFWLSLQCVAWTACGVDYGRGLKNFCRKSIATSDSW